MAEKISLALGKKPAPTNGVKRSHAALREDDNDEQDEGRAQKVSHFDKTAGGAVDEDKKRDDGPLIIAPQANRDWRDASKRQRRQRNGLPAEAQQSVSEEAIRAVESSKPGYGLNATKRESDSEEPIVNGHDIQAEAEASGQEVPPEPNADASMKEKTDDELAMDALLGRNTRPDLVLPAVSEEEAFDRDISSAPDMATLDDYARVPVEQFGAALLRGMGWKEGQGIGSQKGKAIKKDKPVERRPALLGIGAKEEAAVAQEMGAWGKAAKKGGEVKMYTPVLMRDKKTGEVYTEEELQKKREGDERRKYEEEFDRKEREREKRHRRDDDAGGDRRHGHRDGERSHRHDDTDDSRDRRRDRSRRERDRRRDRDDESEDEYRRRKEKERRRRERERGDSDYDRERSRRHDSDRGKRRDRDHDRQR